MVDLILMTDVRLDRPRRDVAFCRPFENQLRVSLRMFDETWSLSLIHLNSIHTLRNQWNIVTIVQIWRSMGISYGINWSNHGVVVPGVARHCCSQDNDAWDPESPESSTNVSTSTWKSQNVLHLNGEIHMFQRSIHDFSQARENVRSQLL